MNTALTYFKNLFTIQSIFKAKPDSEGVYLYLTFLFGLCLILSIIFGLVVSPKERYVQKLYQKIAHWFLFVGLVGLFLILMRWQQIPYLGSRFLLLAEMIFAILWLVQIHLYRLVELPKEKKKKLEKEKFEKYLPRPKKRVKAGLPRNYKIN